MGRLSEAYKYLQAKPKDLQKVKFTMYKITETDELKKLRHKLKLYSDK